MNKVIYKLCQNCRILNGAARSCIYDLSRQQYFPIPDTLSMIFNASFEIDLWDLQQRYPDKEELQIIDEYLQFLQLNDLVIEIDRDESLLFLDLNTTWDFPAHISNCLIDANSEILWFDKVFMKQLDTLCCHHLQLRFFQPVALTHLQSLSLVIEQSSIKSVELIFPDQSNKQFYAKVKKLVLSNTRIRAITLHSSTRNIIIDQGKSGMGVIISVRQAMNSAAHCGIVHPAYFTMNIPFYTESLAHNTCLNRKISIDVDGNIKNCPSMKEGFGNIKDTTLQCAMDKLGFKKYWNITKDEIAKCKDCEFRHVCTDCRAYLENPDDMYSAPLKCGYDPYTCGWEEWSTNPLKQQAIAYYSMLELVKE